MPRVNGLRIALGAACFLLGAAVYSLARPAAIHALPQALHAPGVLRLPAWLGGSLPTFAHTTAFSLFTAAALAGTRYPVWRVCALWAGVNAAFELGQHPLLRQPLSRGLLGAAWPVEAVRDYFARGTFDVADLLAALLGGLAAWGLLTWARDREGRT
jgi:hypothetical protein